MLGLRTLVATASASVCAFALSAALASATATAACSPGVVGGAPPQDCRAPGGEPSRPLESPAAGALRGSEAGFHFRWDDCARVARWAPVHHQSRHGIRFDYYWAWFREDRGAMPMVLVCGEPVTVAGFSRGPGAAGASLPCPVLEHGRQTRRTRPDGAGWWISARAGYSNVGGGFGHNRDGFWNYRFYNPHAGGVRARLYGACRMPPPGHD